MLLFNKHGKTLRNFGTKKSGSAVQQFRKKSGKNEDEVQIALDKMNEIYNMELSEPSKPDPMADVQKIRLKTKRT